MKSAIVLGATSMLGNALIKELSQKRYTVITAGRKSNCDIYTDLGSNQPIICDDVHQADVLFHCAAAFGDNTLLGIRKNFLVNISGCIPALEIAQKTKIKKIIYAGTISSDTTLLAVQKDVYGFSKAKAEQILDFASNFLQIAFCSLRLPQLWDIEGLCCTHQPWFGRIVAYASRGLILKIPKAEGMRNFLYVSDAARLMIRAAQSNLTGIHPITHPLDTNITEFAQEAYKIFDNGGRLIIDPTKMPFRKIEFPKEKDIFKRLEFTPSLTPIQGLEKIREAGTSHKFGPLDVQ